MPTIYVSDPVHDDVLADLATDGVVHLGYGANAVDYADVCESVDAVLLRAEEFPRGKIEASPRLRIIARHGVGTDNVDLDAAREHGVWVTITPGGNARAVAEHVFALILALARKVPEASNRTRSGVWGERKDGLTGVELNGRALGLLGLGSIGRRVAGIGRAFGMDVLVSDPAVDAESAEALGCRLVGLEELISSSDVVSLHAPLLPSTRHIIGSAQFDEMRPGALLINTSRGGLVDEAALVAALRSGRLGGAGLDVLEAESDNMRDPVSCNRFPIDEFDNLLVTPHVAGQTDEALAEVGGAAVACVRSALAGGIPDNAVVTPPRAAA
ncbi:NAD(P)-dependent oxidoreductase [Saccharopolyspora griseoalba]|uniref:NAD(P)-dependent oxidoreductase n=1 Tax=Saccharopolyspora griseoalba TaxID=1431848 RepID=A0ABW2LNT3_9PSEU